MQVIRIVLKDKRVIKVNISDRQNISKILNKLDVDTWDIIATGIHSLTDFNKLKNKGF